MPAEGTPSPVVDCCSPGGAAAATAVADERSRRVEPSGKLFVLNADYKSVMPSNKSVMQSLLYLFILSRLSSVLSRSSLNFS